MYQFSDSESKDSDDGIRFKTDSTRNKNTNVSSTSSRKNSTERSRENSPRRRRRRSRSRSSERRRRYRSRERKHKSDRLETKKGYSSESLSLSDEEVDRKKHPLRRKSSKHHRRRRSRSRRRDERQKDGRELENDGRLKDDNKNKNFQEASDDRTDPPEILSENCRNQLDKNEVACLGPALPPMESKSKTEINAEAESACIGPALPPHLIQKPIESTWIGPLLPLHLQKNDNNQLKHEETSLGPIMPPHLKTDNDEQSSEIKKNTCIGPILPLHLRKKLEEEAEQNNGSDEEEVYGPLPPGMSAISAAHVALEERALQIKLDTFNPAEENVKVREEWMLELPDVKAAHLGMGPRQFRNRAGPDLSDRSSWTDTPRDKEEKEKGNVKQKDVDLKQESEKIRIQQHDKQQEEVIKKHKKKKGDKSLLEMHQDELKSKKGNEQEAGVRRPFSREIDLKVNRFDEAQKKAIFKKAQLLDDRFSAGQSKFL